MTKRHLIIATRESPLALRQAESVKEQLQALHPHLSVELLGITTEADKRLDVKLIEIGGKGLFVKELETALMDGRADIAVHSVKDVPMDLPPGMALPAILERLDPRDAFVSNEFSSILQLPHQAVVGTSSLRRQTQLRALRADLELTTLRGNINTRLKRLDDGDYTAIILAAAGLIRMGMVNRIRSYLSIEESLPSAGQAALGIECRADDLATQALIAPLNHLPTALCVQAERALCRKLNGGCRVPLAAFAHIQHNELILKGLVASSNGIRILRVRHTGKPENAESIGERAAEELLQQGAAKILQEYQ